MHLALIGYGKMGKEINSLAKNRNITIKSIIDPIEPAATHKKISLEALKNIDVAIDFTHPSVVFENIEKIAACKVNLVVGTTGWLDKLGEVQDIVEINQTGLIYSSNFSIGVNLFWKILERACELFNQFEEYDVFGSEFHHAKKADAPSGTAKSCADIILKNFPRKKNLITHALDRPIQPEELNFTATRGGAVPGTHSVYFDSAIDTVEITHAARNRQGFAAGALACAEWIYGKKGIYTMEEYLSSIAHYSLTTIL